ncbi:oxalurate catabolism protein HpxZ [Acetobacter farinalis]|uniref:Oxalurate catabolism protein HpxZ n=1 Tax=Acetobacter farinalis TaxID=1260984 RepID=A0ABT3Q7W7_9PROT|nr:oxalurate catabolism protein HpxZ [Acetobacter farinalis]MCX2561347.1 oxalurate catabolism protein HpxZ [Acetobacter farinalis]NHO30459.1 oxalurate catabolism protein HpxZ [Acetobacter farinalis]
MLNPPALVATITALSDAYETALGENALTTLDAFFYEGPETVRYGVGENLYGAEEIAEFRRARTGGSPPRRILKRVVTVLGDTAAVVSLEFQREGSPRIGRQMQTWMLTDQGWKIIAAHVSLMAEAPETSHPAG